MSLLPVDITSNYSRSQQSILIPSVISNNLSSLRLVYPGTCLLGGTYNLAYVNSVPNTPAGDSWTLYLGYTPADSIIENLIPITFLPDGDIDKSTSTESLDTANALLAPTISLLRSLTGDPEFNFWQLFNWIIVSYYWLFLQDFGQTAPTYYKLTLEGIPNTSSPIFYTSTNNIFVNQTLFGIYSSYLNTILSLFNSSELGFPPPEFLPLDSNNSLRPTATSFLRSYSCWQRQSKPWFSAAVSVIVADYAFMALGYSLVVMTASWWQKNRNIEGKCWLDQVDVQQTCVRDAYHREETFRSILC